MVGFEKSFYIHEGVWLDDEWPASLELDCSQFSTEVSVRCLNTLLGVTAIHRKRPNSTQIQLFGPRRGTVMISSISSYSAPQTSGAMAYKAASMTGASGTSENKSESRTESSSTQTISTLARQLADSASRAAERDKTLTRSELGSKAKNLLSQISGDSYQANKEKHDREIPNTSDPELLARAKQATEFVNRNSNGGSEKNPFASLSNDQLSIIIYDDSGAYTINERRAAWSEAYDRDEAWREKVCAQAMDEYNRTGKMTNFFKSVLDYFNELPAIEQAQYPNDYASDLQSKIDLDFNYRTHRAEGKGKDPMSLIEMLFVQGPQQTDALWQGPKNTADREV